jgi:DNA-binding CsgD family transcriptional regulator
MNSRWVSPMMSTFVLRCSRAPYLRFAISESVALLGRSYQCDFVLDDPSVSRHHAEIRAEKSALQIADLNSRNGTFVNDERKKTCSVSLGQVISFGNVAFDVTAEDLDASEVETDCPVHRAAEKRFGSLPLSDAQRRVFDLLVAGLPEKAISRRLNLSQHTVHTHVTRIYHLLGVHSRAELLASLLWPVKSRGDV